MNSIQVASRRGVERSNSVNFSASVSDEYPDRRALSISSILASLLRVRCCIIRMFRRLYMRHATAHIPPAIIPPICAAVCDGAISIEASRNTTAPAIASFRRENIPINANFTRLPGSDTKVAVITPSVAADAPIRQASDVGKNPVLNVTYIIAPAIPPPIYVVMTWRAPAISHRRLPNQASHRQLIRRCQKSRWVNIYVNIVQKFITASCAVAGRAMCSTTPSIVMFIEGASCHIIFIKAKIITFTVISLNDTFTLK